MRIIYDIGVRSYYLFIRIAALWNPKAEKWISGREGWREQFSGAFGPGDRVVWFHCASLGEFEQGRPVMEAVRAAHPEKKILLTFFSPSGYEKRKDYPGADFVGYLPRDTVANATTFLRLVPVEQALFVKYEFWYHMLKGLHDRNIPVSLVSGHFRKSQVFFRWYGGFFRRMLRFFTHIFVQTDDSARLLEKIGVRNVTVAGDTRFDRVMQIAAESTGSDAIKVFAGHSDVIIAGSTWEADEVHVKSAFEAAGADCKLIIAPHEVADVNVRRLLGLFPGAVLFSQLGEKVGVTGRVVIVDTIGHLSSLYQYGTIAYIGGGFGKGIHNILEATAAGLPVFFGPAYGNFSEARELVAAGGAFPVNSPETTATRMAGLLNDRQQLQKISQQVRAFTKSRTGATQTIMEQLF
ncbi:MAG: glycosyltransferase N-terminal domain-containing protein [Bacteroidales bacterium]|nr:glycosyltransferase N-terminal domain-containing protein [Bacteroidales bacterium]MDT8432815.1 glycosyltransferase N-terminal domain-containing protein [Bacteroidales bacterium]